MLSVSYAGKNAYSAGKTSGVLRGGASGANRCYVLAHCGGRGSPTEIFPHFFDEDAFSKENVINFLTPIDCEHY